GRSLFSPRFSVFRIRSKCQRSPRLCLSWSGANKSNQESHSIAQYFMDRGWLDSHWPAFSSKHGEWPPLFLPTPLPLSVCSSRSCHCLRDRKELRKKKNSAQAESKKVFATSRRTSRAWP